MNEYSCTRHQLPNHTQDTEGGRGEFLDKYLIMFCWSRCKKKYIRLFDKWCQIDRPWTKKLLLDHLLGHTAIGLFPSKSIDYLMLDVDNHNQRCQDSVITRVRRVLKAFCADALVYTSSDSGGMRVLYFLDAKYPREHVEAFARGRLQECNIEVKPGYVEIMAGKKGDRLPFGDGSNVVDIHTLESIPHLDYQQKIEAAWRIREAMRLEVDPWPYLAKNVKWERMSFDDKVQVLLEVGLPDSITTNDALLALCYYYRVGVGLTEQETERALSAWVRTHHNGNSNRINNGKIDDVGEQITRMLKSFDVQKVKRRKSKWIHLSKKLTIADVRFLKAIIGDPVAFKPLLASFSLLHWVKNKGVLVHEVKSPNQEVAPPSGTPISNLYVSGNLQIWKCEIPFKTFQRLLGFNSAKPSDMKETLTHLGLIAEADGYNRSKHKCNSYFVYFKFDEDSKEVVSLEHALQELCGSDELVTEFGRYRASRIIKKEVA